MSKKKAGDETSLSCTMVWGNRSISLGASNKEFLFSIFLPYLVAAIFYLQSSAWACFLSE